MNPYKDNRYLGDRLDGPTPSVTTQWQRTGSKDESQRSLRHEAWNLGSHTFFFNAHILNRV